MTKGNLIKKLMWAAFIVIVIASYAQAGTLEAYSSTGVMDTDNSTPLFGNVTNRCLVQLIWVGPNGIIAPADSVGNTTEDASLLGTTYIGYGYPFNPDEGKFVKAFTHDLLGAGTIVYVRAWNDSTPVGPEDSYGDSDTYELQSDFDSHDFGTWHVVDRNIVPVELASFTVEAEPGRIVLSWTTQSETENLGFYIFRSESENGQREQLTTKMINGAINSQSRHKYTYEDENITENKTYYYWLADVSANGVMTFHGPKKVMAVSRPTRYALEQNYPNPFNPSTSIHFTLKDDGVVRINIYNVRGQLIRQLVDTQMRAGEHVVEWDGRDQNGSLVPTGTYLYSMKVNGFSATHKMALTK